MGLLTCPPPNGPLASSVGRIWFCEIGEASGEELLLPTGKAQVIFGLDPSCPGALVQGPMATARVVNATMQRRAVGVSFHSGGLAGVVGGRADLFVDELIEVGEVFGADGVFLFEELAEMGDPGMVMDRLGRFLTRRAEAVGHRSDPAVQLAVALLTRGVRVAGTAARVGLDRRELASRFRAEVGVGLKLFARLRRFEAAVAAVRQYDAPDLSAIAARMGYADQAHMTRDFREFATLTPSELHRDGTASPNHVVT